MILTNTNLDFSYWAIIIGGLGLFLFGISFMSTSIKRIAGDKLKKIITKCTNNKFLGLFVGCGFTAVIQSSSATTALTIGLVRAGLMTLVQAVAIIIGANIGTTITSFIIAIPFSSYLSLLLFIGAFILLLTTRRKFRNIGDLLFSIGCIFFGLMLMSNLSYLANEPAFMELFKGLDSMPWLGLLVGTATSAVIQSSAAVIGIMQGLYAAAPGAISLFGVIPVILGANVGTTTTALISAIGGSKESKRLALFHVFFNVTGALIFMGLNYAFEFWTGDINNFVNSSTNTFYFDPMVTIALFHLVFNVAMTVLVFPFINPFCKLMTKIIPDKGNEKKPIEIKELDNRVMREFPSTGLYLANEQLVQEFGLVILQFKTIENYINKPVEEDAQYCHELEDSIDKIDRQLNAFLLSADKGLLNEVEFKTYSEMLRAGKDVERIGDYGESLIGYFETMVEKKQPLDEKNLDLINEINIKAVTIVEKTKDVYVTGNINEALEIIKIRRTIIAQLEGLVTDHLNASLELQAGNPKFIDLVYADLIGAYTRVFSHCSNICKLFANDKLSNLDNNEQEKFAKMKDRY